MDMKFLRDLPLEDELQSPMKTIQKQIAEKLAIVPILRAGTAIGWTSELVPAAKGYRNASHNEPSLVNIVRCCSINANVRFARSNASHGWFIFA